MKNQVGYYKLTADGDNLYDQTGFLGWRIDIKGPDADTLHRIWEEVHYGPDAMEDQGTKFEAKMVVTLATKRGYEVEFVGSTGERVLGP